MGELRDRMVRLMGVKRYAKRTEEAYLHAVEWRTVSIPQSVPGDPVNLGRALSKY